MSYKNFIWSSSTQTDVPIKPIRNRLLIPLVVALMLLVGGFSILVIEQYQQNLYQSSKILMDDITSDMASFVEEQSSMLNMAGQVLLKDEILRQALRAGDKTRLLARYSDLFLKLQQENDLTHFYFIRPDRICLLRIHKPEKYGDLINRFTMLQAERTGRRATGLELGPLGTFTLRSVHPVYEDKTLVGYIEIGKEIEDILSRLRTKGGFDIALFIKKDALDRRGWEAGMKMLGRKADWDRFRSYAMIYCSLTKFPFEDQNFIRSTQDSVKELTEEITFKGRSWHLMATSIKDVSNTVVGKLILVHDITSAKKSQQLVLTIGGSITAIVLIVLIAFLYILLDRTDKNINLQHEELLEREDRFRSLVEGSPNCVNMFDHEGRYLSINQSGLETMGWTEEDIIGKRFSEVWPEELQPMVEDAIECVLHGEMISFEADCIRSDGVIVTWWVTLNPIIEEGDKVLRFVGILNNITERKQVENELNKAYADIELKIEKRTAELSVTNLALKAEIAARELAAKEKDQLQEQLNHIQKMESVGRLAGGIAHDFNNMLGVIMGHTELILMELDPDQPIFERMHEIRKAAGRSADLTCQLLAFARKQTIVPKVLDLNQTVEGMLKMIQRLIGEEISLSWIPGFEIWPIKVDPSQIDHVLANLCINARDAITGTGKIIIKTERAIFDDEYCSVHAGFIPGDYMLLSVSDNGCGMDKNTIKKLFDPFFTTKEVGKGTGLGMATVYGIIEQNRGFINVYSEQGQGTTFRIYLPRYRGDEVQEPKECIENDPEFGNETIMVVEDEPSILAMATTMLERLGYTVLTASTPGMAVEVADNYKNKIDLLITDVIMPEMNGHLVADKIISIHPEAKCLFMSGYTADIIAHQGVLDEGLHFIQKPFSIHSLSVKVRDILGHKNKDDQF